MSKETPDHHDAELVLRVYEMRREAVLRESRSALQQRFWPKQADDVMAVTKADHPLNAAFRQVSTYWEMVYGMVRHGIVHPGYFLESNGEGLFHFAKMEPYVEHYRREVHSPLAFRNVQWVATECPEGRALYEVIKARVQRIAATK
jgi:hypothetical protein